MTYKNDNITIEKTTGLQLKKAINHDQLCVVLDNSKTTFTSDVIFSEGEVKDSSFSFDEKTLEIKGGFFICDKKVSYKRFYQSGFEMKEFIADIEIPDDAIVIISQTTPQCSFQEKFEVSLHKNLRSIRVDKVVVKKIYPINELEMWKEDKFVQSALRLNINNLIYIEGRKDEFYKESFDKYLCNDADQTQHIDKRLLDIMLRVNYEICIGGNHSKSNEYLDYFLSKNNKCLGLSTQNIEYIVSKNEDYFKSVIKLSFEEKKDLFRESKFLRDKYMFHLVKMAHPQECVDLIKKETTVIDVIKKETNVLDIIIRIGADNKDVYLPVLLLTKEDIEYLVSKDHTFIACMEKIPKKERQNMLSKSKLLRDTYGQFIEISRSYCDLESTDN